VKIVNKEELRFILDAHKKYILGEEGGVRANLEGADLRGADLVGANLVGANLKSACLYGVDLEDANLYGADLKGANLEAANLVGANLQGANLEGVDLEGTELRGANLYGVDLRGAYLRGADLYGADLTDANLEGADLRGANLRGADLEDANLSVIKKDYFDVLIKAIPEITNLRKSIVDGKIDGSTYEGECACLCGTLENNHEIKQVIYDQRDWNRPIERFFLAINKGDTPETSQFSKLALIWLDEFIDTIKPYVKDEYLR
jgi:hypothetical protein